MIKKVAVIGGGISGLTVGYGLKKNGISEFDLGGYDSKELPGISKFKQRIGGKEVKYSEKWLKII